MKSSSSFYENHDIMDLLDIVFFKFQWTSTSNLTWTNESRVIGFIITYDWTIFVKRRVKDPRLLFFTSVGILIEISIWYSSCSTILRQRKYIDFVVNFEFAQCENFVSGSFIPYISAYTSSKYDLRQSVFEYWSKSVIQIMTWFFELWSDFSRRWWSTSSVCSR